MSTAPTIRSASRRTPGDWCIQLLKPFLPSDPVGCKIVGAVDAEGDGDDVASVVTRFSEGGRELPMEEWLANAQLLSGAPRMWESILNALERLDAGLSVEPGSIEHDALRRASDCARGAA